MQKRVSKLILLASALALSSFVAAPAVRATDAKAETSTVSTTVDRTAQQEAKRQAAILKKYDKNGNGILDPDELARFRANQAKMQKLRDAKKRKALERQRAAEQAKDAAPIAGANP